MTFSHTLVSAVSAIQNWYLGKETETDITAENKNGDESHFHTVHRHLEKIYAKFYRKQNLKIYPSKKITKIKPETTTVANQENKFYFFSHLTLSQQTVGEK